MFYFDTLPKITTPDENGNRIVLTNILTRAALLEEFQNNPMLFYQYSIQDGDTPEIVADKYYNSPYSYWIILYSNNILDPLWEWPLTREQFFDYIDEKYKDEAAAANLTPFEYTNTTIFAYQKITKTTNLNEDVENIVYTNVTEDDYNSLSTSSQTYTIGNVYSCNVEISKRSVTIFDYEYQKNEDKRIIKILNSSYVARFEKIFKTLMSA